MRSALTHRQAAEGKKTKIELYFAKAAIRDGPRWHLRNAVTHPPVRPPPLPPSPPFHVTLPWYHAQPFIPTCSPTLVATTSASELPQVTAQPSMAD